jgi:hypothetical protein
MIFGPGLGSTLSDAPSHDQFFSGTVVELADDSIRVSRTVLGKESGTRTFAITSETRVEGKPKVNTRVTVRFVTADSTDRAVHIIVRDPPAPPRK